MKKNTSKIENKGISVLRNLIDNMDCVTHSFGENNTEISWDGDIKLYKNPDVDDKGNLSSIIRVQVKSRTKKIPSSNSINFLINKKDLKNYLLENGTMFFVIIFNKNNEFKILYHLFFLVVSYQWQNFAIFSQILLDHLAYILI